jgi:hypothetical protein
MAEFPTMDGFNYRGIFAAPVYNRWMSLEPHFTQYPNLKAAFWPEADSIKWVKGKPPHPLVGLVQNTDERAKHIAGRTYHCCRAISKQSPNWLKAKAAIVLSDEHPQNISATLGEIRAFGELIWLWQDKMKAGKHGMILNSPTRDKIFGLRFSPSNTEQSGTASNTRAMRESEYPPK